MTRTVRTETQPSVGKYSLTNQEYIDPLKYNLIAMGRDRMTFFASDDGSSAAGNTLYYCTDLDTAAVPTWIAIKNFTGIDGRNLFGIHGIIEMANGEVLVGLSNGSGKGVLYRSTGFATNKLTATWTVSYLSTSGPGEYQYTYHRFNAGDNGVVLLTDSSPAKTTGIPANDVNLGGVLAMSTDFGVTFNTVFDLKAFNASQGFPNAAGMHMHGCAYDEVWDRLWLCYGDGTGDGDIVAGAGFQQVVFSDDRGVTWQKLPASLYFGSPNGGGYQFVNVTPLDDFIMFGPDVGLPAVMCYPRMPGKTLGEIFVGTNMTGTGSGEVGQVGGTVYRHSKQFPTFFGTNFQKTMTTPTTVELIVLSPDQRAMCGIPIDIPVDTPNSTGVGFTTTWGPTVNNKIVSRTRHHVGGANKNCFRATLVAPS